MRALTLTAEFAPREGYSLGERERSEHRIQNGNMVWKHPRITLGDTPDPVPKADEVIVQVAAVGICGSDMHMYEADAATGYMLYPGFVKTPNILGHEFAGRVVALAARCAICKRATSFPWRRFSGVANALPAAVAMSIIARIMRNWALRSPERWRNTSLVARDIAGSWMR